MLTCVSWYRVGSPETPQRSQQYGIEDLRGLSQFSHIMPRDAIGFHVELM